jgi:rRNA pseudouridine-1189 N-methylase Emg1 (Nep1/Mra1 family)
MKTKILITVLLTGLSLGFANSQPLNKAKLDSLFNILAENNKAMGSLTLSKNGTVIYSKVIGYSLLFQILTIISGFARDIELENG